jgi:iron complex transport system substrate-binding protein
VLDYILLLGRITGETDQAGSVVTDMRGRIDAITGALADIEQGPTVFFELTSDLYSAGPNTFIGGMIGALKGRNVAEGAASDFPQLSAEAVIAADPEVILLADAEFGESAETVGGRPGWSGISAVVNGRIHGIHSDLTSRPGPRIVEGLEAMAQALYPDRFE